MSHIPNSAMPHAAPAQNEGQESGGKGGSLKSRAGKIAGKAKENPKTAIAAGAAVVAGVLAAAAIPLVRGRAKAGEGSKKSGGAKKSSTKKDS